MTPFSEVYEAFFLKMEKDPDFFRYFDLDEDEAMELASQRARAYLRESLAMIMRRHKPLSDTDVSLFTKADWETEEFEADFGVEEIDLLSSLMLTQNFKREFSKMKAFQLNDLPTTLQVFSPANERKTMQAYLELLTERDLTAIDNYFAKDRTTGTMLKIDYDAYSVYSE